MLDEDIKRVLVHQKSHTDKILEPPTAAGEQLLAVIIEPEARMLTVTEICQKAGISRDTYYRMFKDPRFLAAYLDACKVTAVSAAMPAVQTIAARAVAGDWQAGQTILQLSGLHTPTVNVNQTIDAGPTLRELLDGKRAID